MKWSMSDWYERTIASRGGKDQSPPQAPEHREERPSLDYRAMVPNNALGDYGLPVAIFLAMNSIAVVRTRVEEALGTTTYASAVEELTDFLLDAGILPRERRIVYSATVGREEGKNPRLKLLKNGKPVMELEFSRMAPK